MLETPEAVDENYWFFAPPAPGRPAQVYKHVPLAEQPREESRSRAPGNCAQGGRQAGRRAIWLVTFMHYDLGYFDNETCRLEPIDNPFGPKLLPMSPE